MQERRIKIFKSFEDQEAYRIERERQTTPIQRFINLFYMQQFNNKVQHEGSSKRKITIHHGYTAS
jgi:hypothetical protein